MIHPVLFIDCMMLTCVARVDPFAAGVLALQVCFQRYRLDAGVTAIVTFVWLLSGVTHSMSSEGVVVTSHIIT